MGALVAANPLSNRAYRFDIASDAVLRHDALNLLFCRAPRHAQPPCSGRKACAAAGR
jgi:hypothetical protein